MPGSMGGGSLIRYGKTIWKAASTFDGNDMKIDVEIRRT